MHIQFNINLLIIANFLVLLLWPASGTYTGARQSVVGIIMLIITIIVVLLDIIYIVLGLFAH